MPLCFDLDGTLGHFSSGFVLLREALGGLWGQAPTAEELGRCTGSTDWEIVDELHRMRFGLPLTETGYADYERACVTRFRSPSPPAGSPRPPTPASWRVSTGWRPGTGSGWSPATPRPCWPSRRRPWAWIRPSPAWAPCPATIARG